MNATLTTTPEHSSLPALADDALTRLQSLARAGFYGASSALLLSAFMRRAFVPERFKATVRDAYKLHYEVLSRPGMKDVMRKVEREDLAMLPFFAALLPIDAARVLRKQRTSADKLPVQPTDDFAYPEYYLNDFHNQANGNLSYRAALTYEWQIRFLFLGTNRLMRQSVIDALPEGDALEVLDVATGTGAWLSQAWLQNRRHRYTGIDLSPQYLRIARLFRGNIARFEQRNAEALAPEWTGRFDVVSCVWLFHELPTEATERVTAEMARVLKPGGKLLFMDAAQRTEALDPKGDLEDANRFFSERFNEPYFMQYQHLDLPALFARHGLTIEKSERWYASRAMTLRKAG